MTRANVDKMAGVLEVREHRSAAAQRAFHAARAAAEASARARDEARDQLNRAQQVRDDEVEDIKRSFMKTGRRGDQVQISLLYVRQLDSKTRAAEVNCTRCEGELARARQQAEIARYEAVDMRIREEKARHLLEHEQLVASRHEAAAQQIRLEAAHDALLATRRAQRQSTAGRG